MWRPFEPPTRLCSPRSRKKAHWPPPSPPPQTRQARPRIRPRLAAVTASRDVGKATMAVRVAENLKARAEEQLAAAETALGSTIPDEAKAQAEDAKQKALARIAQLQAQWAAAKTELQPKLDAVADRRGLRLSRPTPCGAQPPRRRKRLRASSSRYRCSSAARPSASMSDAPSAHLGKTGHDPGPRSSDRHECPPP